MAELGYVFAISNAVAAILQLVSGPLSDRYGRRNLHLVGTSMAFLPPLIYTFARSWVDLIPWVILFGASVGIYTPIRWSIVSDLSTSERRGKAYSLINMSYYTGFIVGPFLGGFIADLYHIRAPLILCFILLALTFPLSLLIPETGKKRKDNEFVGEDYEKEALFVRVMTVFSLMYFIEGIGFGLFNPITPVFVVKRFSVDLSFVGLLYTLGNGAVSTVLQVPGGWLADKYDKRKIVIITYFIASPFFLLFALASETWELFIFMALSLGLISFPWSAHQSLRMNMTPRVRWGLVNALSYTMFWGGMTVGSALSGLLWESFGMLTPYYASAISMFLAVIPIFFLGKEDLNSENNL